MKEYLIFKEILGMNVHKNAIMKSSLNKLKCRKNPVFMRVCGASRGLLITN